MAVAASDGSYECVFWDGRAYSDEGCHLAATSASSVTCACNHLTSFAVIVTPTLTSPIAPPTVRADGATAMSLSVYVGYALVRVSTNGSRAYVNVSLEDSAAPTCNGDVRDNSSWPTSLALYVTSNATLRAVACADGRASELVHQTFHIIPAAELVLKVTISGPSREEFSAEVLLRLKQTIARQLGVAAELVSLKSIESSSIVSAVRHARALVPVIVLQWSIVSSSDSLSSKIRALSSSQVVNMFQEVGVAVILVKLEIGRDGAFTTVTEQSSATPASPTASTSSEMNNSTPVPETPRRSSSDKWIWVGVSLSIIVSVPLIVFVFYRRFMVPLKKPKDQVHPVDEEEQANPHLQQETQDDDPPVPIPAFEADVIIDRNASTGNTAVAAEDHAEGEERQPDEDEEGYGRRSRRAIISSRNKENIKKMLEDIKSSKNSAEDEVNPEGEASSSNPLDEEHPVGPDRAVSPQLHGDDEVPGAVSAQVQDKDVTDE
eukprot:764402-Hanusia_phi.AAC.1